MPWHFPSPSADHSRWLQVCTEGERQVQRWWVARRSEPIAHTASSCPWHYSVLGPNLRWNYSCTHSNAWLDGGKRTLFRMDTSSCMIIRRGMARPSILTGAQPQIMHLSRGSLYKTLGPVSGAGPGSVSHLGPTKLYSNRGPMMFWVPSINVNLDPVSIHP